MRDFCEALRRFRARTAAAIFAASFGAVILSTPLPAQQVGPLPPAAPRDEGMPVSPSMKTPRPASSDSAPAAAPDQSPSSPISTAPPAIPVDQIIQKFAAHESEFRDERNNFTYTQTHTVQTIDDAGRPDGEYTMTSDITFTSEGKRNENVTYAPQSTLERIMLTQQDFDDLRIILSFMLTTEDLPKYNVTYVGRQAVDALGTYVFDVSPKTIEKNQRYFQGRIWVDDRDFAIVKTDGRAIPDAIKGKSEDLSARFETFRENIEGHYWFPTYTRSDDVLHFKDQDVRIHMSVRYTNYKRFRVAVRLLPTPQDKKQ